jgi:hypothetical protein
MCAVPEVVGRLGGPVAARAGGGHVPLPHHHPGAGEGDRRGHRAPEGLPQRLHGQVRREGGRLTAFYNRIYGLLKKYWRGVRRAGAAGAAAAVAARRRGPAAAGRPRPGCREKRGRAFAEHRPCTVCGQQAGCRRGGGPGAPARAGAVCPASLAAAAARHVPVWSPGARPARSATALLTCTCMHALLFGDAAHKDSRV